MYTNEHVYDSVIKLITRKDKTTVCTVCTVCTVRNIGADNNLLSLFQKIAD